jgi:hypothetical protein
VEPTEIKLYSRQIPYSNGNRFSANGKRISELPSPLLKALVQVSRKNTLWLIDTGFFAATNKKKQFEFFSA